MIKPPKKEYDVLDGDITNPFHKPKPFKYTSYNNQYASHSNTQSTLPSAEERFKRIKECEKAGLVPGAKVIRVNHVNEFTVNNPLCIGVIKQYTMSIQVGWHIYMPMLVEFTSATGEKNCVPFHLSEIELIETARKQVNAKPNLPMIRQETIGEEIIKDIMRSRNGVVPFRHDQYVPLNEQ